MEANIRKIYCLIVGLSALTVPTHLVAQEQKAIYVSPTGSDRNDGLSPNSPFVSPERAEVEILKHGGGTVFLMGGVYERKAKFIIPPGAPPQKWKAFAKEVPIFEGGGKALDAIWVKSDGVTIEGLTIRNFLNNGIWAYNASNLTVSHNHISNIASTKWGQGGVEVLGNSPNAKIINNIISQIGYAGVEVFGNPPSDTSGTLISDNVISDTCRTKDDCGAIYVSGRSRKSDGAVITNNRITNYGSPPLKKAFGIYLDDFASHMKLAGNIISGRGSNPIFIHGGEGNVITNNIITISSGQQVIYYDTAYGPQKSDMRGNRVERNTIRGVKKPSDLLKSTAPGKKPPIFSHNRMSS